MAERKTEESDIPCRQTYAAAVNLFLQLAKERAQNGVISVDTLDIVAHAIQNDPTVRKKYCDTQFERCAEYVRLSLQNTPRINVYGRIISEPFEHLFKKEPPLMASGQLVNFFHAIQAILGRAEYENLMERSLRLMEQVSRDRGNEFKYSDLYETETCWEIRWDSFVALADFFTKFNLRKEWYKRVMQSDPDTPGQGIGPYPFSEFQFKQQMMCIFDAFANLSDDEHDIFEKRYSKKQRKDFSTFLANVVSIEDEV